MSFMYAVQWLRHYCPFKCHVAVQLGKTRITLRLEAALVGN